MQIGDTYEYKNVVTKEITAGALGSGGLDIFATPFLICWMEAAAYYYMKEQLPEGKSSVGTSATFPPPPSARRSPPRPS